MTRMNTFNTIVLCAGLALATAGCEEAPATAGGFVPRPARAPQAPAVVEPVPPAPTLVYSYNPVGKRDPFRSPLEELQRAETEGLNQACTEPLCQWELEQVKLVAVVTGDANPFAMVEDPLGRGHVVRRGSRMGRRGGRVTQVLRSSVTVTEFMPGNDGKLIANPVSLTLPTDEKKDTAYDLVTGRAYGE